MIKAIARYTASDLVPEALPCATLHESIVLDPYEIIHSYRPACAQLFNRSPGAITMADT